MTDLIERLASATGPDAFLDDLIWRATDPRLGGGVFLDIYLAERDATGAIAPAYTASIDAALTLETEQWKMRVLEQMDDGSWLCIFIDEAGDREVSARHADRRIAICIAALRAGGL